jgi:hypothetical protein
MLNEGKPLVKCTSTVTKGADIPNKARDFKTARLIFFPKNAATRHSAYVRNLRGNISKPAKNGKKADLQNEAAPCF